MTSIAAYHLQRASELLKQASDALDDACKADRNASVLILAIEDIGGIAAMAVGFAHLLRGDERLAALNSAPELQS